MTDQTDSPKLRPRPFSQPIDESETVCVCTCVYIFTCVDVHVCECIFVVEWNLVYFSNIIKAVFFVHMIISIVSSFLIAYVTISHNYYNSVMCMCYMMYMCMVSQLLMSIHSHYIRRSSC